MREGVIRVDSFKFRGGLMSGFHKPFLAPFFWSFDCVKLCISMICVSYKHWGSQDSE